MEVQRVFWHLNPHRRPSHGMPINSPDVLFAKIEDEDIVTWTERFGGEGN